MIPKSRTVAVAAAGFCAFLNLYSPQALLPVLAREFGVGPAEISAIMTASALAIALSAPFTGAVADVLGRKRVIAVAMLAVTVPMAGAAFASDVPALIGWRFLQGLLLPPIFAVTVAYIGDEWPPAEVAAAAGIYVTGSSLGGFCGRFVPGVLGDLIGSRGALSLAGALIVIALLPAEKNFMRSGGMGASARQMLDHLRNPQLLATYAMGFGVLFNFIAVFTYVSFHLAAEPYRFSSTLLGTIFITYLVGAVLAPMTGWMIARLGRRPFMLAAIAAWACGALITLVPSIAAIVTGLILCAGCGMLCQTVSTSYVTSIAKKGRSSAVGLYVTSFYTGGSVGAFLPGLAWRSGGWPACIVMVVAMLAVMALIAALAWRRAAD
ncbi:MAG: MFS transporter [Alphaproteobacteria bacterium]|nr:MAG: MFS transporter [Alphaproteobacteria bacterium]